MRISPTLPAPPHFNMRVLGEASDQPGFLRRISQRLALLDASGEPGPAFAYDQIDRENLDAVVVVPHFVIKPDHDKAQRYVVLRSAVRPPVVLRSSERSAHPEPENRALWEAPAGLVEAHEISPLGLRSAACREMREEVGFVAEPEALQELGPSVFPAPGMVAERQYFFHLEVDPACALPPSLDGSSLEEVGQVIAIPLQEALQAARLGRLQDAKTELCLRRLEELLRAAGAPT